MQSRYSKRETPKFRDYEEKSVNKIFYDKDRREA